MRFEKRVGSSILMVLGLTLAGCQSGGIAADKSPFSNKIVRIGDTAVAEVDGTSIYMSDIEHAALAKGAIKPGTQLTPASPVFQTILDELIDQRLLALEALRRSLDQNDETRRRLAIARERILSNVVVETLLAESVTDEAVQRMYDQQAAQQEGGEQVRARHILVATEEKAKELWDLVDKGGSFRALAKEFSTDQSTRDLSGDLGYFSKKSLHEDIANIAFATPKGEVSAPFETKFGWHILMVEGRRATPKPSFEEIKPEIVSFLTYDAIEKQIKSLRSKSNIELKLGGPTKPKKDDDAP